MNIKFLKDRFVSTILKSTLNCGGAGIYAPYLKNALEQCGALDEDMFPQVERALSMNNLNEAFSLLSSTIQRIHDKETKEGMALFDSGKFSMTASEGMIYFKEWGEDFLRLKVHEERYIVDCANLICTCEIYVCRLKILGLLCRHITCTFSMAALIMMQEDTVPELLFNNKNVRKLTLD